MFAPEGKRVLVPLFILTIITGMIGYALNISTLKICFSIIGFLFLFSLYFFRDPHRSFPKDEKNIYSPADGKVVQIIDVNDPDVGEDVVQVSIFLSVFNVHVNRVPVDGTIKSMEFFKGKFLEAFNHKASKDNQRTEIVMETKNGNLRIRQITGAVARRIFCYADPGSTMHQGDRLGYIMFGSRTDIIFPKTVSLNVEVGTVVKGGMSVIGRYESNAG